jgi:transposase
MTMPSTEREIRRRRRYAPSFKAKIVAACLQGDASIAQVALHAAKAASSAAC